MNSRTIATPRDTARVLVVDDEASVLDTICALLDGEFEVQCCDSGINALKLAENGSFDVLCTDHSMPQMTGLELIGAIERRRIMMGIVLVTGRYEEFQTEIRAQHPEHRLPRKVLTKPYQPDDLIGAIRTAASFARMKRALTSIPVTRGATP